MDGFVDKQNCRIWKEEKLRLISEKLLHLRKYSGWFNEFLWFNFVEIFTVDCHFQLDRNSLNTLKYRAIVV